MCCSRHIGVTHFAYNGLAMKLPSWSSMTGNRRLLAIAVAIAVVGVIILTFSRIQETRRARNATDEGPVPVVAATARLADVPVYLDGVGTTRALNTVTVRAQVDGKLMSINFREGQDVKRGDVLGRIDPTTYQAMYDQAVAKKAQDEATLANAKIDLERYQNLAATNSIARQQLDTQKATVAQLEALVKLDQAAIDNARAVLDYTVIVAPLDGRTGIRQVDEGNIVKAADTTGIVVITQIKPMSIFFTLPQQQFADVNRAFNKGSLTVDALGSDNRTVIDRGVLVAYDNQVDQTTGTIKLKAEFPNNDTQLWPGQFVNVRLLINTLQQVVVVPTAAIQRGPSGQFVYVIQGDNTVQTRPIAITQQDENQAVIARGLEASERVVTTGFARLRAGVAVAVTNIEDVPAVSSTPQPPRRGRRGEGRRDGSQRDEEPTPRRNRGAASGSSQ
jgi:membrane fusion protein, multidrug efflux system